MIGYQLTLFIVLNAFCLFFFPHLFAGAIRDWKGGLNSDGSKKTLGGGLYRIVTFCMSFFGFLGFSFGILGIIDSFGYIPPGWFTQIGHENLWWTSIITCGVAIIYALPFTLALLMHWVYPKISREDYLVKIFNVIIVVTWVLMIYLSSLSFLSYFGLIKITF